MGPFKGWLYINDKLLVLKNFVCYLLLFYLVVSFLILFCSHLQNIDFLAKP